MIGGWLTLVGCTDGFIEGIFSDPASTESWYTSTWSARSPLPEVVDAHAACVQPEGWWASATTDAWTGDATFTLLDAPSDVFDEFAMGLVGTDPEGGWDERAVGPLAPGVDTGFACADADRLSFVVRVYDPLGELSDCVTWGADISATIDWMNAYDRDVVELLGGCRVLD